MITCTTQVWVYVERAATRSVFAPGPRRFLVHTQHWHLREASDAHHRGIRKEDDGEVHPQRRNPVVMSSIASSMNYDRDQEMRYSRPKYALQSPWRPPEDRICKQTNRLHCCCFFTGKEMTCYLFFVWLIGLESDWLDRFIFLHEI